MNLTLTCRPTHTLLLCATSALLATQPLLHSQFLASDDASNYLNWTNGSNGGYGFTPWVLNTSVDGEGNSTSGFFLGSSSQGGWRTTTIDTAGYAFGIWNNDGGSAEAIRGFDTGVWHDGSQLSFDFSFRYDGGNRGITLGGAFGNEIFYLVINGAGYEWNGGSAPQTGWTGQREHGEVISLTFTQNGGNVDFSFSGIHASSPNVSGSVAGTLETFRIFHAGAGGGGGNDIYVNNLQVIPEPSTYAAIFGGLALLGAFAYRRRTQATAA